jgi:hypothetical protein
MDDLIEALTIFRKYGNPAYPTHCEHDEMFVCGIDPGSVSAEDLARLEELSFTPTDADSFSSFKFGSC